MERYLVAIGCFDALEAAFDSIGPVVHIMSKVFDLDGRMDAYTGFDVSVVVKYANNVSLSSFNDCAICYKGYIHDLRIFSLNDIVLESENFNDIVLVRAKINPILAGESKEADSASSVSRFFVKKQSKEADSASFGCSIFFQFFFSENR